MANYLTSDTLIDQIKNIALIPTSQSTFSSADFLHMANQEMRIGMLPSIMQFHQEYLVYTAKPMLLLSNKSAYAIPERAVGGKLREVFFLDVNNSLCTMTRVDPDNKPYYQGSNFQNGAIYFCLEGNDVVILPKVSEAPSGSLVFSYFMRPNELVDASRVSTILGVANTSGTGSITAISAANPSVITSVAHGLSTGNIIKVAGSNSTPVVDGYQSITVIDSDHFSIPVNVTSPGTQGTWTFLNTVYTMDSIPTGVAAFLQGGNSITGFNSSGVLLDILQTKSGHKTIAFDITPLSIDLINKTITFATSDVSTYAIPPSVGNTAVAGDYIAFAGESIIPQIPSDLHDVLAQRVALRCLQSLGDAQGYQIAQAKLVEMEKFTGMLIDNRVEGAPQKATNNKSLLRRARLRYRNY